MDVISECAFIFRHYSYNSGVFSAGFQYKIFKISAAAYLINFRILKDYDMKDKVQEVIETIRPMLQADGGDIELVDVEEETGVVKVRLQGACKGCPGARMTLKMGVERRLQAEIPAVTEVVAVD